MYDPDRALGFCSDRAGRQSRGSAGVARRGSRGRARAAGGIFKRGAGVGSALPALLMAKSAANEAKGVGRAGKGFYRPLGWGVLRAPLLPVEAYSALSDRLSDRSSSAAARWRSDATTLLPADPWVRLALAVGGGHLVETLGDEEKKDADAPGKLLRYQIRMSTRPTPYGIFAGVGLGKFAEATDVLIDASSSTRRARPDMEWLFSLVGELEARPEIRRQLRVMKHPAAFVSSGRVFLADSTPLKDAAHLPVISIRESRAVSAALAHAKDYVPYQTLAENLCRELEADTEKVDKLLTELWQQGLLLTDLRPPLTEVHPAEYVAQRLLSLPAPPPEAERLKSAIAVTQSVGCTRPIQSRNGMARAGEDAQGYSSVGDHSDSGRPRAIHEAGIHQRRGGERSRALGGYSFTDDACASRVRQFGLIPGGIRRPLRP